MSTTLTAVARPTWVPLSANQAGRVALAVGPDRWVKPPCHFGFWIHGAVDPRLVARTLTAIARRHSALRYVFDLDARRDAASCLAPSDVSWPLRVVDLRASSEGARDAELRSEIAALRAPFSLNGQSLTRATLIRRSESTWLLGISVDHIVFDGGSVSPFLRDFERLYRSFAEGTPSSELGPGSDFGAFAVREGRWLESEDGVGSILHWLARWPRSGPFRPMPLPAPCVSAASGVGSWSCEVRPDQITQARQAAGASRGVSAFGMVTAALVAATRQVVDHPTGWGLVFPFSRRVWPGTRHGIGYYNNRLYLDIPPNGERNFPAVIREMQEPISQALTHGMVPLELLLRNRQRELYDRKPTASYLFVNMTSRPASPRIDGAQTVFTWLESETGPASVRGLTFNCEVGADKSLSITATYNTEQYDRTVMEQLLDGAKSFLCGNRA